jgi:general stress protein 26
MKKLPQAVIQFFQNQGFVIVSTVGDDGIPHNSCKGILKISSDGQVYLLDLYKAQTYKNLKRNPKISITAVDEHQFKGYSLKGKAKILLGDKLSSDIIKLWDDRITGRVTKRIMRNIREEKGLTHHAEVLLPQPEYMIVMEPEEIIELTPSNLRQRS